MHEILSKSYLLTATINVRFVDRVQVKIQTILPYIGLKYQLKSNGIKRPDLWKNICL
jgi:hypothetical protein